LTTGTARSDPGLTGLLTRRLVFVTGKGGTGKSTVATALGLAAAASGRRAIVAEVARRDDVSRALGAGAGEEFTEAEVAPGLFSISIDPQHALEEYLIDQLPMRSVARRLSGSRVFTYLAAATPGMRELLSVGKAWELAQPERRTPGASPYDLVVVDAPATGHGLALLGAPETFARVARVGPIARQGHTIHATLVDPAATAVVAVTTPDEMAVSETLELSQGLRRRLGIELAAVVVNGVLPHRIGREAAHDLRDAAAASPRLAERERAAVNAALDEHTRAAAQVRQIGRLRRGVDAPLHELPRLFADGIDLSELQELGKALERAL
jgi:anion-transporting  ArsA/GET3 family ATPase